MPTSARTSTTFKNTANNQLPCLEMLDIESRN